MYSATTHDEVIVILDQMTFFCVFMADQRKLCTAQSCPVEGSLLFIVLVWAGMFIIAQHFHNKHRIL